MSTKTVGRSAVGGASDYYARELYPCAEMPNDTTLDNGGNFEVYYVPIRVPHPLTVDAVIVYNGAVAGNRYVGVYNSQGILPNARLATSLSTVAAGANQRQAILLTAPLSITIPRLYFAAIEWDSLVATFLRHYALAIQMAGDGVSWYSENLGAYLPLPANATPVQSVDIADSLHLALRVLSIP